MDDNRLDQDYTAPRYTRLQLSGDSLPPRQPSSRPRNSSHRHDTQGPSNEDIEAHLSPREFLPPLPPDPYTPAPTAGRIVAPLRAPDLGESNPFQLRPPSQLQQAPTAYTLRPITLPQPQGSTVDATSTQNTRTAYRMADIRGGVVTAYSGRLASASTSTTRSNTSTPGWSSPSRLQDSSPDTGIRSPAGTNGLQLSRVSGQSGARPPSTHSRTQQNTANFTFDYGVPATTAAASIQSPGSCSPTMTESSFSSATVSTQLGQVRPREADSQATGDPYHRPLAPGQAMVSGHDTDVLARPSKKPRTAKSTPNPTRQVYSSKPPSQLGHYAREAQSFLRLFRNIACAVLLAKNPFPNPDERRKMIEEAWDKAEEELPRQGSAAELELNDDLYKLASDAQKTFRNRVKREGEDAVNDMGEVFGIVPKNTIPKQEIDPNGHTIAVQNNIQVSALSRANANLVFRQWRNPDQPRQGPFKNPAIERVLLVAFRSVEAEGAKGFYLFKDRMPGESIAFACAVIDVCLEEYSQGAHNKIEFTANSYRSKWEFYRNEWLRLQGRDEAARDYTKRLQSYLAHQAGIACGKFSAPSIMPSLLPAAITPDDVLE